MVGMARYCRYEEDGFAAGYALGLLDGEELAEYEAHLIGCPICPTEVAACLAASADLALAYDDTPDLPPTPEARARLLTAAVAEREARATTNTVPLPALVSRRRRIPRLVPLVLAAALVLFIGAGLLLRVLVPGAGAPSPDLTPASFSFGTTGGAVGQATYRADQRLLRLSFQGLPLLNPGQVYQLWLLRAEGPESIQVFRLADGTGTTSVTVDLTPYRALYVTIEPAPDGSRAPTTGAVVAAALPGSAGSSGGAVPTLPCPTAVPSCETPPLVRGTATRTTVATPRGTALPIRTPTDQLPATRVVAPVDPSPTTLPTSSPMTAPSPVPRGTLDVPLVPSPTASLPVAPATTSPPTPAPTVPAPVPAPPVPPPPPGTPESAPTRAMPLPTPGTFAPVPSPAEPQSMPPSPTVPPTPVPSASALPTAPPRTAPPPAPTPPSVPTTQPAPPPTPTLLPRPAPSSPPEPPPGRSGTPVRP